MLPRPRLVNRVFRIGLTLAAFLALNGAAQADSPTWHDAVSAINGSSIEGVSCASPTTCMAVGGDVAVEDGGPLHEVDADTNSSTLNAVSCAPATRFCMVVDNNGGAVAYNNGTFGTTAKIDGGVAFESVSCESASLCMAIDHNDTVFHYNGTIWDTPGTPLTQPAGFSQTTNVSCGAPSSCVALASAPGGEYYSTWNGATWSYHATPFDTLGGAVQSLTCTSASFCLATDGNGNASVYNGTNWPTTTAVTTATKLWSSCAATACEAIDFNDLAFASANGSSWSALTPQNLHMSVGLTIPGGVACATATLCVAGDGMGHATTYGLSITPTVAPILSGTATVGQTLSVAHAIVTNPDAWFSDTWARCDQPDSGCIVVPGATGSTYTLTSADAGEYIDAREEIGVGLDEGSITSSIVGPISSGVAPAPVPAPLPIPFNPPAPTPKPSVPVAPHLGSTSSTTSAGVVTISLTCPAGRTCAGTLALTVTGVNAHTARTKAKTKPKAKPKPKPVKIGSASYSVVGGKTAKVKIKLTTAGKKLLSKHHGKLSTTLTITPKGGHASTHALALKVKH